MSALATIGGARLLRVPDVRGYEAAVEAIEKYIARAETLSEAAKAASMIEALKPLERAVGMTEARARRLDGIAIKLDAKIGWIRRELPRKTKAEAGAMRAKGNSPPAQPSKKQATRDAGIDEDRAKECDAVARALPDELRDRKRVAERLWNWAPYNDCFTRRARLSDVDGIIECNGRILIVEGKPHDEEGVSYAAGCVFSSLVAHGVDVLVLFGDPLTGVPVAWIRWTKTPPRSKEPCALEDVREFMRAWWDSANESGAA